MNVAVQVQSWAAVQSLGSITLPVLLKEEMTLKFVAGINLKMNMKSAYSIIESDPTLKAQSAHISGPNSFSRSTLFNLNFLTVLL